MAKMRRLVELRAQYPERLSVLGINFDDDVAVARRAIERHGLDWPQVHAASTAAGDAELWQQVSGIRTLPRLLLVDADGVLREDLRPGDLEQALVRRLGER